MRRGYRRGYLIAAVVLVLMLVGDTARSAFTLQEITGGPPPEGYLIQGDAEVAVPEKGPVRGGGSTVAHYFFRDIPYLGFGFRKRVLHPGSAIGYHRQTVDGVYYVVSGTGEINLNGKRMPVGPGDAILTRAGSWRGLRQTGADDLVIVVVFDMERRRAR